MGRSDVNWGTVERLDGPLPDTDTDTQPPEEVYEVPELTDDVLREMEESQALQAEATSADAPQTQRGEPGSQVECEVCGRSVRVKQNGELGKHKCEAKPQRGNRFDHIPARRSKTPPKVHDFAVTVLAWAVEEGSAQVLARPFGVDSDEVPTELPDAEGMIGPPLDMLWPSIPDSAQKFIAAAADNSDLIACALAWGDWVRQLSRWTRDMRAHQQHLVDQERQHGPTQFAATNGVGRVVPFEPS